MNAQIVYLKKVFADDLLRWGVVLLEEVEEEQCGKILKAGWSIRYRFGKDERGLFLDYYAAHRMTNDRHVRLRSDGTREDLPVMLESYSYRQGARRKEIEEAEAKYYGPPLTTPDFAASFE
jgi:hypothetical protein